MRKRLAGFLVFCFLSLFTARISSASITVTAVTGTASTTNASTYASGSFTPAANDVLLVFVTSSGTAAAGTMTDSQSLGFTSVTSALKNSSADIVQVFISNAKATATSMTVTFHTSGGNASGCIIQPVRLAGMLRVGASAIKQSAVTANHASGAAPAFTFGSAALTGNAVLSLVGNSTSPPGITVPAGSTPTWTQGSNLGYSTPTTGGEWTFANSGFTGTTLTWGSTSASAYGVIGVEVDASAAPTGVRRHPGGMF